MFAPLLNPSPKFVFALSRGSKFRPSLKGRVDLSDKFAIEGNPGIKEQRC